MAFMVAFLAGDSDSDSEDLTTSMSTVQVPKEIGDDCPLLQIHDSVPGMSSLAFMSLFMVPLCTRTFSPLTSLLHTIAYALVVSMELSVLWEKGAECANVSAFCTFFPRLQFSSYDLPFSTNTD